MLSPRNLIRARFGWYRETHGKWDNVGCISSLACILALDEDLGGRTSPTRHLTVLGISVELPRSPLGNFGMAIQTMDRNTRNSRQEKLKGQIFSVKYFVLTSVRHR